MDRTVGDLVAGQQIVQVTSDTSVREAGRLMTENNVGSILVIDDDRLQGIFTERDALRIFVATRRNADWTTLKDIMTADPKTIGPEATVKEALEMMNQGGYRHLPVVEDGKILGVVSYRVLVA